MCFFYFQMDARYEEMVWKIRYIALPHDVPICFSLNEACFCKASVSQFTTMERCEAHVHTFYYLCCPKLQTIFFSKTRKPYSLILIRASPFYPLSISLLPYVLSDIILDVWHKWGDSLTMHMFLDQVWRFECHTFISRVPFNHIQVPTRGRELLAHPTIFHLKMWNRPLELSNSYLSYQVEAMVSSTDTIWPWNIWSHLAFHKDHRTTGATWPDNTFFNCNTTLNPVTMQQHFIC